MSALITELAGVTILSVNAKELVIGSIDDFMDPLGNAAYQGAEWVALPVEALSPTFFDLSSKVAGEILQKLMNYNLKCAIIGDISHYVAVSNALRDFVYECNNGHQIVFLDSHADFENHLANA